MPIKSPSLFTTQSKMCTFEQPRRLLLIKKKKMARFSFIPWQMKSTFFFKWNSQSCVDLAGKWISFPSAGIFHLFRWIKRTRQPIFFNRISTCHQYMSALCSAQNTYSALRANYMFSEGKNAQTKKNSSKCKRYMKFA